MAKAPVQMDDPFNLARFVTAQDAVYHAARSEIRHGKKTSHWMWFIFPQIAGLGFSPMSKRFAITSAEEARAYLNIPSWGRAIVNASKHCRACRQATRRRYSDKSMHKSCDLR
jgi:uncharacterized protein (DUF1810 family)